jgi:hypothetical protein
MVTCGHADPPAKPHYSSLQRAFRMKRAALPKLESSGMLSHFTRASRAGDAVDNLEAILREGVIRGSTRMVRGGRPVVCLFGGPLEELKQILVDGNRRRYQPFGIAFDKRYAFKLGARPVLYMPWAEAKGMLPEEELWRVVAIDLTRNPPIDWSFEREWRLAGDLSLPARGAVALVRTWGDADDLYARFDGKPPCAGVIPLADLFGAF